MGAVANITKAVGWFKGEDKTLRFKLKDADGDPLDPTGMTMEWVLRLGAESEPALITKTTPTDITFTFVSPDHFVNVAIADLETDLLPASENYHHTLKRTDAGNEGILADGSAVLQPSSTRP